MKPSSPQEPGTHRPLLYDLCAIYKPMCGGSGRGLIVSASHVTS